MARPPKIEKKSVKIQTPATEAEKADWEKSCAVVEQDPPDMLRKLVSAFVKHVQQYGEITSPIRFAPPSGKIKRPK